MATLTKSELADRILEHIGVKAAGQGALAEDSNAIQEAIDSAHARLRREGKVKFVTSLIPEWAWTPLRDYVAAEVASMFGVIVEHSDDLVRVTNHGEDYEYSIRQYIRNGAVCRLDN